MGVLDELLSSAVPWALSGSLVNSCMRQLMLEPSFSHKNTGQTSCSLGRLAHKWVVDCSCLLISAIHRVRTKEKEGEKNLNTTFINSSLKIQVHGV